MSGYRSGGRPDVPAASVAAALAELLQGLGFRAMALQCAEEREEDRLQLYARIILKHAKEPKRGAILDRLEYLGLV